MERKRTIWWTLCFVAVMILVGCGEKGVPPRPGRWEGDDVSFRVTESGTIADLEWFANRSGGFIETGCPINFVEMPVKNGVAKSNIDSRPGNRVFRLAVIFHEETSASLSTTYSVCIWSEEVFYLDDVSDEVVAKWVKP